MKIVDLEYAAIDRFLEDVYAKDEYTDYDEYEIANEEHLGSDVIIAYGPVCRVTGLGLIFMEGVYCCCNEETGELEPDWSLTLIYEDVPDDEFDPMKYLYFEQDGPTVSIHNFLHFRG